MFRQGRAGIGLVVVLAAGVTACGSSDATLDAGKLEREIRVQLEQSNRVRAVDCPDDVKSERGTTFECTATVEGTRQIIDGKVQAQRSVSITLRS